MKTQTFVKPDYQDQMSGSKQAIVDKKKHKEAYKNIELVERVIQIDEKIMAAELVPILRPYASRKGSIAVDSKLNQLKIREYTTGMDELVAFIKELEKLGVAK
jgi:hypothetical protein